VNDRVNPFHDMVKHPEFGEIVDLNKLKLGGMFRPSSYHLLALGQ
jgi:hypothetical protein